MLRPNHSAEIDAAEGQVLDQSVKNPFRRTPRHPVERPVRNGDNVAGNPSVLDQPARRSEAGDVQHCRPSSATVRRGRSTGWQFRCRKVE